MLKSHERFYTTNGKRLLLVVEDDAVNREMLGYILAEDYQLLYAENGKEALETVKAQCDQISLILLDLHMPVMDGFELLKILKSSDTYKRIPVIVLTSEKPAEVQSLQQGAADFITKPYDMPDVIKARVRRSIELAEETYIIQATERDELTGLLNREFFYRYADQFDTHHADWSMDAVSIDINHFHLVNELFGWAYGDEVLRKIGQVLLKIAAGMNGVAGRKDSDVFLLYCPHGTDLNDVHDRILEALGDVRGVGKIRVRMGVYENADRGISIEQRFDRAKLAADSIRSSYTTFLARYDRSVYEDEYLAEQLINDMDQALEEKQFQVFYQPKYNIRGERPVLASAEALVRWKHPERGMISPGIFITIFEKNGLIQKLDRYVWKAAAEQMRLWKERCGVTVPVSVNVSRMDMYAPDFADHFLQLVTENGIRPQDYYLEITESAYTEDSEQLMKAVEKLRSCGFPVEMDDFGSGYSSLNMISRMPLDALKLDMDFIRNLFTDEKNIRIVELMIDIAKYLGVPVIAEGVETEEQMLALKKMGCDMIQGYYFSRPLPAEEFEELIKKEAAGC